MLHSSIYNKPCRGDIIIVKIGSYIQNPERVILFRHLFSICATLSEYFTVIISPFQGFAVIQQIYYNNATLSGLIDTNNLFAIIISSLSGFFLY